MFRERLFQDVTGMAVKEWNMSVQPHTLIKDKFREMLHAASCRVTSQRLLLLELLHDCDSHVGADDLYHLARSQDPRLSLSTVYRTLNKLKEVGLVHELHLDDDHHHYELVGKGNHHHLICLGCGKIIEIRCFLVDEILTHIEADHNFKVTHTQIELTGYCADCQATSAGQEG
jgi:Fur family ferric uptake transcriptional regulator